MKLRSQKPWIQDREMNTDFAFGTPVLVLFKTFLILLVALLFSLATASDSKYKLLVSVLGQLQSKQTPLVPSTKASSCRNNIIK